MSRPEAPGVEPGGRYDEWDPDPPAYVVTDVDGTLVGPAPHASPEVEQAVARAQAAGLDVGFATGRMRQAVEPLYEQLHARGPHLLHNGAEVRHEGATVATWPLRRRHLEAVVAISARLDAYVEFYLPHGFVVARRRPEARAHWEVLGHEPLGDLTSLDDLGGPVLKVTFALFDGDADAVTAALEEAGLASGPSGSPLTPEIDYVNGTHPDADKGVALRTAAQHRGVGLAAVVAVGDAPNDLSMLAVAGTAIAMGQAPEVVKQAAHVVVPDVDSHGLAHALHACVAWRA